MKKNFIIYPETKIEANDPNLVIVDAPIKVKLKSFITGYREDYGELPSIERIVSLFHVTEQDAHIALTLYG